jgi:hypothetical protein
LTVVTNVYKEQRKREKNDNTHDQGTGDDLHDA